MPFLLILYHQRTLLQSNPQDALQHSLRRALHGCRELQNFLHDMRFRKDLMHSDRWSLCYDFLKENYPEATGTIVTGLTYWLED